MFANDLTRRIFLHYVASGLAVAGLSGQAIGAQAATAPSFAVATPIHIGSVSIRVRDLAPMVRFYNLAIGLDIISRGVSSALLGKDGEVLLELHARPMDVPDDRISAGLYHTAFLMPSRRDLGAWLIQAAQNNVAFTGFSDHLVSEAIYLDDPEGNGIEVYADRSPISWTWDGGEVKMATEELNIESLIDGLPRDLLKSYSAPSGLRIGHVHLRVGNIETADAFYRGTTGLDATRMMPERGAAFFANGRYHHHVGTNIWQSRDAGKRNDTMSGLENVAFSTALPLMDGLRGRLKASGADFHEQGDIIEALDPWGTKVRFVPAA